MGLLDLLGGWKTRGADEEVKALVDAFVTEANNPHPSQDDLHLPSARAILDLSPEAQIQSLLACVGALEPVATSGSWRARWALLAMLKRLLQRRLPYAESDLVALLDGLDGGQLDAPIRSAVSVVERFLSGSKPSDSLARALQRLKSDIEKQRHSDGDLRKQPCDEGIGHRYLEDVASLELGP